MVKSRPRCHIPGWIPSPGSPETCVSDKLMWNGRLSRDGWTDSTSHVVDLALSSSNCLYKLPFWRHAAFVYLWRVHSGDLLLLSHPPVSGYSFGLSTLLRHSTLSRIPRCQSIFSLLVLGFSPHVGRSCDSKHDDDLNNGDGDDGDGDSGDDDDDGKDDNDEDVCIDSAMSRYTNSYTKAVYVVRKKKDNVKRISREVNVVMMGTDQQREGDTGMIYSQQYPCGTRNEKVSNFPSSFFPYKIDIVRLFLAPKKKS